jgi:hypothetical protein
MIRDDEGNLHELTSGTKGIPVLVSAKTEIYRLLFGKERISSSDLANLDEIHTALVRFIWYKFSYRVKLENQDQYSTMLQKYNLKKIKRRDKK